MERKKLKPELEETYEIIVNNMYEGTIKVELDAPIEKRIERLHKILPKFQNKVLGEDYSFKFVGVY